ncbi:MAG: hypothetical protein OXG94_02180, partial [Bacteroidetes bacterium]|nr:hypothetical protein [Bacteroidota bacterium]
MFLFSTAFFAVSAVQAQILWEHRSIPGKAVWTYVHEGGGILYLLKGANSAVTPDYGLDLTQCRDLPSNTVKNNWTIRINRLHVSETIFRGSATGIKICPERTPEYLLYMPIAEKTASHQEGGDCGLGSELEIYDKSTLDRLIDIDICFVNSEADLPPVVMVPGSVEVAEGQSSTFSVRLSAAPSGAGDVTVTVSGHAGTDLEATPPSPLDLTFTSTNWNTVQQVTLTAAEDNDFVDDPVNLTLDASGGGYVNVTKTVAVTIKDNDTAGLTVRDKVEVPEGSDKKMDVVLSAAPSADVTVTISGHAGTDLTPSPTSLTFTPANWNTDQPVMLTAVQDNDFVDDLVNLTLTANGGGYVDLVKTVALTIVDDDAPSDVMLRLKASPDRVEEGNMVTLTATLSSALPAAVTVSLTATPGDPPTEPNDYGPLPE